MCSLSYEKLIQHRFGSHVVQTLLTLAALTIDREVSRSASVYEMGNSLIPPLRAAQVRGVFPPQQAEMDPSEGVLPFMTDSVLAICKVRWSLCLYSSAVKVADSFSPMPTTGAPPNPPLPHSVPLFLPPDSRPPSPPFRPANPVIPDSVQAFQQICQVARNA